MDFKINDKTKYKKIADHLLCEWTYEYELFDNIGNREQMIQYLDTVTVFSLTYDNNLIGFALLVDKDCNVYPHLSPWLASVFIVPEYRGLGYSKTLLQHITKTTYFNQKNIYLWCQGQKLQQLYSTIGFKPLASLDIHHHLKNITVMVKQ